ncbi:pentatricopeptide repeat-containing protein At5g19020, mitochondrial-like [Aristolochia californica]|uniref:pentatricopeptide repeat-containing protein At5g19020, mitochondrial-like n=1 Tax=Aristolochia californica TaxID=171875 RepID=UPI0035DBFD07
MISGYAQNGQLESVREIFDQMSGKVVFTWSSMISDYAQNNRCRETLVLFKEMQSENNVRANEVTMSSILLFCAWQLWSGENGSMLSLRKNCMPLTDNLGAALNALNTSLAANGVSHDSFEAFKEMQRLEIYPNDITLMGLLMAFCHEGLVQEGQKHIENASKIYGIQPEMKHYGCMIDMRAEQVYWKKQKRSLEKMSTARCNDIRSFAWCFKIHGNVHVARCVTDSSAAAGVR